VFEAMQDIVTGSTTLHCLMHLYTYTREGHTAQRAHLSPLKGTQLLQHALLLRLRKARHVQGHVERRGQLHLLFGVMHQAENQSFCIRRVGGDAIEKTWTFMEQGVIH
jgi:hypothetical protein